MFTQLKQALGFIGAALAALWLYLTAHKKGRAKGQQETLKAHEKIIEKIEQKEGQKHAVDEQNVQNKLNHRFGGKPSDL